MSGRRRFACASHFRSDFSTCRHAHQDELFELADVPLCGCGDGGGGRDRRSPPCIQAAYRYFGQVFRNCHGLVWQQRPGGDPDDKPFVIGSEPTTGGVRTQLALAPAVQPGQSWPCSERALRDMSYSCPGQDLPGLDRASMALTAGQVVAFVGFNGSGASTKPTCARGLADLRGVSGLRPATLLGAQGGEYLKHGVVGPVGLGGVRARVALPSATSWRTTVAAKHLVTLPARKRSPAAPASLDRAGEAATVAQDRIAAPHPRRWRWARPATTASRVR